MEIAIVGLIILVGVAIIGLSVSMVVMTIRNSEDRTKLERLIKAKDLREYELYNYQEPEEEEVPSIEERYIPIEELAEHIGKQE
jgi:hypothetical protein